MEIFIGFLSLLVVILLITQHIHYRAIKTVPAGSTYYVGGNIGSTLYPAKLLKVKPPHALIAIAMEDGPEWKAGNALIIDGDFDDFIKGHYYLFEEGYGGKKYRIAKCISNSRGFPPIFNGSETFVTHNPIGEVVCVWDRDVDNFTHFN